MTVEDRQWHYKQGYKDGRADATDEELQELAQWLWDNHYLVDEAFTIRLVEQYKTDKGAKNDTNN